MTRHLTILLWAIFFVVPFGCSKDDHSGGGSSDNNLGDSASSFFDSSQIVVNSCFDTLFEYTPAPGQYINKGFDSSTPQEAAAYGSEMLKNGNILSLGGFGGYVVVGFYEPIVNDGGYNIQIQGNSFSTSSEPAIVWVSADVNGDGEANDLWYELKGSDYNLQQHNYSVTYFRPSEAKGDTRWVDSDGKEGAIYHNIYNNQDFYYPAWIVADEYTLSGARLENKAELDSLKNIWQLPPFEWGYVDNFSSQDRETSTYGEGSRFNHFKISDAVDSLGKGVDLPSVHFVKVVGAVNGGAGTLGEVSTEILSIKNYNKIKEVSE